LVAHYDFEGSNPLEDKSGNGHDATLESGAITSVVMEGLTEDTAQVIANASDIDGTIDTSTLTANNGVVTIAENGDITYTPNADYNGTDTVNISVTDNDGATATQTITLTVDATNDNPVAVDDVVTTVQTVLPQNAEIVSTTDDSVTVRGEIVSEGARLSSIDHYTFTHNGGPLTIDTLTESGTNFTDIDGDGTKDHIDTMMRLYNSSGSQVAVNDDSNLGTADGSTNDYYGHIQDSYISLNNLPAGEYTLSIGSWNITEAEVANDQNNNAENGSNYNLEQDIGPYQIKFTGDLEFVQSTIKEDTSIVIDKADILVNDTDVEGDALTIIGVTATADTHGSVSLDADGNVAFTPAANYNGEASFIYTVSDGNGGTDTATVTLNIQSDGNDAEVVATVIPTDGADSIISGAGDDTIDAGAGNDYIDGGLGADTINAGSGDDSIVFDINDTIDGGEGLDTLIINEDMDVDLSALDGKVSNIEAINLGDGTQNITSITLEDVISVTDSNVIRIDGDASDHISLDTTANGSGEWTLGDFQTESESGAVYDVYTGVTDSGLDVTIEVNTQIQVDES
ncbi:MAG: DVUA0089 family protein, partial [Sulfurimonas sp.]|uniref:DVUA0089 family protein n=1 Tax=Sulfurimonas sp. TaxID=2022749 RepID=UPI002608973A